MSLGRGGYRRTLFDRNTCRYLSNRNVLTLIGNTPLVKLDHLPRKYGIRKEVKLFAKLELFNPGGSVKDRAAINIILDAIKKEHLTPNKIILDATSGNTGISYAMISTVMGYRCKVILPANANRKKIATIRAYGAEVVLTDPVEGIEGAISKAQEMYEAEPERYFYANQYDNEANWIAHYHTTGPEIIKQTRGRITYFVAGVGTSGTLMGAGRRLKEFNQRIKLVEVQPDSEFHGIEGLKYMDGCRRPKIYGYGFSDNLIKTRTEDAYRLTRELAMTEGLLVGISSGAAMAAALEVARDLEEGLIVIIFPDGGQRYLDERFWTEALNQPLEYEPPV